MSSTVVLALNAVHPAANPDPKPSPCRAVTGAAGVVRVSVTVARVAWSSSARYLALEGPHPKRPSAGRSSAGICRSAIVAVTSSLVVDRDLSRPAAANRSIAASSRGSGTRSTMDDGLSPNDSSSPATAPSSAVV